MLIYKFLWLSAQNKVAESGSVFSVILLIHFDVIYYSY